MFVAASGAYRDNFPTRMLLIDKCVRLAADDPDPVDNYVREGTATMAKALRLAGHAPAAADDLAHARVFGQPPGQYGTQILHLIPRGGVWDSRDEITAVYRENMSYVFTQGAWGERREGRVDAHALGTTPPLDLENHDRQDALPFFTHSSPCPGRTWRPARKPASTTTVR